MVKTTEIFYTASIREGARLQYWNDVANDVFGAMQIQPASRRFSGCMKRRRFGRVQLVRVESTPVAVQGLNGSGLRGVYLLMNQSGSCELHQRGRRALLRPGALTVLCAHEPYFLRANREHVADILYIPGSDIEQTVEDHIAVAHPPGECELLTAFLRRLVDLGTEGPGPGSLLQTSFDLIELSWPTPRKRSARAGAAVWEQRLRQCVEQYLGEVGLGADRLAEVLGISARYVQLIFARMGTTASHYILERRLQVIAERLLSEPAARIGDIALETGFSDLSYFCRCFRSHFGVSARAFRSAPALGGPG